VWYEASDAVFVRYLLGELPDEDRDRLEDEYFEDDAVHERLLALECELVDAYVRGELSPGERRHFEDRFVATPEGREKVARARSFEAYQSRIVRPQRLESFTESHRLVDRPEQGRRRSWWEALTGFFRFPANPVALASISAGLILVLASLAIVGQWWHSVRLQASAESRRVPSLPALSATTPPSTQEDKSPFRPPDLVARVGPPPVVPGPSRGPNPADLALPKARELPAGLKGNPDDPVSLYRADADRSPVPQADDDPFPVLRENAERLRAAYEKTDAENMKEVDRLIQTRSCQNIRIGGLLDRTIQSMREWNQAETTYWKKWAEYEQPRVDAQRKSLAGMEADQQRASAMLAAVMADRKELLKDSEADRQRASAMIAKELLKDSEARLSEAQKNFKDVTAKIDKLNASITARITQIRQNVNRVESYGLEMAADYEKTRAAAQEICNR